MATFACDCPQCADGIYIGNKYQRPCFRCQGKGYMSEEDVKRNARYDRIRDKPMIKKIATQHHEILEGENDWYIVVRH